jgi:hypothetical protein
VGFEAGSIGGGFSVACSARLCLNEEGLLRRRWAGKPVEDAVGVGAGGVAGAGSRSRISPIRENGEGAGLGFSGGNPSSSSRSKTKRSPAKAMAGGEKREVTSYVSAGPAA